MGTRIIFLIVFLFPVLAGYGNGAPYTKAHITEVYFGDNFSKTIEIRFEIIDPVYDSAYCIYSSTDSAFLKVNPTEPGTYLITYLDLTSSFIVHKNGDSLYMKAFSGYGSNEWIYITPTRFIFGDIENSHVNSPQTGQSLIGIPDSADTWSYNTDKYPIVVLDTCPSLGYEKDPVRGTIEGYILDSLNQPIPYLRLSLEGICERTLWTDANGYFIDTTVFGMNYQVSVEDHYSAFHTVEPDSVTSVEIILPLNREVNVTGRIIPYPLQVMPGSYAIFTPEHPDAPIDTILTDSLGWFDGTIYCGTYSIRYSREQYIPWFTSEPISIQQSKNFGTESLYEGDAVEIERGEVSGTWTNLIPYYIFGDILIEDTDSLTIEPGAYIYVCGDYSIRIEGTFYSLGTEGSKIIITGHSTVNRFNEVKIIGPESSGSVFEHIIIEEFNNLVIHNTSPYFLNSSFDNYQGYTNIISGNSEPIIESCGGDEPWEFGSFDFIDESRPIFINNVFWSPGGTQFLTTDNACPQFLYNTFYHYWIGLWSYSENAIPYFKGNIFCSGGDPTWMRRGGTPDFENNSFYALDYPLYYDIPGFGILDSVNIKGDSCDIYGNIFDLDPLLADPDNGDFHLLSESPCIDAGDPDSPYDPDNTIADMGAYYYDQIGIYVKENNDFESLYELKVIPNPNRGDFTISINSRKDHYYNTSLSIYSINGDLIDTRNIAVLSKGENLIRYSGVGKGSKMKNGLFICTLNIAGNPVSSTKILIINE